MEGAGGGASGAGKNCWRYGAMNLVLQHVTKINLYQLMARIVVSL